MNIFRVLLQQPLASGLVFFYKILGNNLGLAIIGFSIALRFVLNPLTKPYMESMKKMKEVAPALDKLKKKYKGDKAKLMQAQTELYKQKGINPGAGCLPYILQIVILIAFFRVFSTVLAPGADVAGELNKLIYPALSFAEDQVVNTNFLYLNLAEPDTFEIAGTTLPGALLIFAALAQFASSKIMAPVTAESEKLAKKTPGSADDTAASMQKSMIYFFPFLTLIIGLRFSSGLVLYWLAFSIFQFFQQYKTYGLGGLRPLLKKIGAIK